MYLSFSGCPDPYVNCITKLTSWLKISQLKPINGYMKNTFRNLEIVKLKHTSLHRNNHNNGLDQ
jgi:hypothetical protein